VVRRDPGDAASVVDNLSRSEVLLDIVTRHRLRLRSARVEQGCASRRRARRSYLTYRGRTACLHPGSATRKPAPIFGPKGVDSARLEQSPKRFPRGSILHYARFSVRLLGSRQECG